MVAADAFLRQITRSRVDRLYSPLSDRASSDPTGHHLLKMAKITSKLAATVVVTAPDLPWCFGNVYVQYVPHQLNAGSISYAKFKTFPVWEFFLSHHPVNLVWHSDCRSLDDAGWRSILPPGVNLWRNNGQLQRDIEIFLVLKRMLNYLEPPHASPTDMGVNMVGYCIMTLIGFPKQEIIRFYYKPFLIPKKCKSVKSQ